MKAIQIAAPGGPEVLKFVEVAEPVPGPGEVLVAAHAIGVGKPDVLFRTGVYRWMPPLPAIPGAEMSGRVTALGPGVAGLAVGQPVLVYRFKGGCYAERTAVAAAEVTPLPASIDLDDAVAIPNFLVAQALLEEAARGVQVRSLYLNGAAGGVGSAVIQLCRLRGIETIAGVGSAEKAEFVRRLGATNAIDYSREDPAERVDALTGGRGVDLVLDHIAGPGFCRNFDMLAPMGLIVSFNALGGPPEDNVFKAMRAHLPKCPGLRCFTMHGLDADARRRLAETTVALFAAGTVKPPIHARLHLSEAQRAHTMLDAREVLGKLILKP